MEIVIFADQYIQNTFTMKNEVIAINIKEIELRILEVRGLKVLLDCDVAELYGVETKRINEAVKNNPDKFPDGYLIELTKEEVLSLRSKISTLETGGRGQYSKYLPKAFVEEGLYMLATILKSPRATATTIAIIETFKKMRELVRSLEAVHSEQDNAKQKGLIRRSGELLSELLVEDGDTTETESTIELNLMAVKFKHTVKRTRKKMNDEN